MSQETADPLAWSNFGSCTTADPELFFPRPGANPALAKSICRGCPVRRQCLDYAIETAQKHGIWGGMTEGQRRRLRRQDPSVRQPGSEQVAAPIVAAVAAPVRHLQLVR